MKGIDMLRTKMKDKLNSTINHIKANPAVYGYIVGAAVGITSTYFATNFCLKNYMKDMKLVDLTASLKDIHDEGLIGLKFDMGDETMLLIPASHTNFDLNG